MVQKHTMHNESWKTQISQNKTVMWRKWQKPKYVEDCTETRLKEADDL